MKNEEEKKVKVIQIRTTENFFDKINGYAKNNNMTVSELIRQTIEEKIGKEEF